MIAAAMRGSSDPYDLLHSLPVGDRRRFENAVDRVHELVVFEMTKERAELDRQHLATCGKVRELSSP